MTESDLRDARNAVVERIDNERQHVRRRHVVAAAAAAVVIAGGGVTTFQVLDRDDKTAPPSGPTITDPEADFLIGDAPTPQLIDGVWRVDNGQVLVRFDGGGGVWFDELGTLFSDPLVTGSYDIEGDLITVTATGGTRLECIGQEFAMRASIPKVGAMRFVDPDLAVDACSPLSSRGNLEQVLPTSQALMGLKAGPDRQPLPGKSTLYGDWVAEGGGYVLEITRHGSYYVADDSGEPIDSGSWALSGTDLTLTSADSAQCSDGDKLVLAGIEQLGLPGTIGIGSTVRENTCGGDWTPAAWILLPHLGS